MPEVKISELDVAAALAGDEIVPVVQSGATVRTTISDLLDSGAFQPAGDYALAADLSVIDANVQTASYTLALSDAGKAVEMNVAGANNLTVPPNSSVAFPVGTVVEVCQVGAGQTTIVAGSGVTIHTPETLVLSGQWSTVSLRKRGTDLWVLAGDVEAAA